MKYVNYIVLHCRERSEKERKFYQIEQYEQTRDIHLIQFTEAEATRSNDLRFK